MNRDFDPMTLMADINAQEARHVPLGWTKGEAVTVLGNIVMPAHHRFYDRSKAHDSDEVGYIVLEDTRAVAAWLAWWYA